MRDKRIAMRGVYKAVLEEQAGKFEAAFIAQGTLYTDIVESGGGLILERGEQGLKYTIMLDSVSVWPSWRRLMTASKTEPGTLVVRLQFLKSCLAAILVQVRVLS